MEYETCIFCKIARGEIPSAAVYEDGEFKVILDMGPASRGHALILPKAHFKDITEADSGTAEKLFPLAAKIGRAMKEALGASGFNVVQNNGSSAGQTVFHLHVHIIPRYEGGPKMVAWDPGKADPGELAETARMISEAIDRNGQEQV